MRYARWYALLSTAAFLAACGGGAPLPGSTTTSPSARKATAVFHIKVPKRPKGARAHYVSPATQSLTIALDGPSVVNESVGLTPSSPNCSLSLAGTVCTLTVQVAPGSYTATITAYDAAGGTGKALSTAQAAPFTVAPATANQVNLTLAGIPASLEVVPASGASLAGVSGKIDMYGLAAHPMIVQALDADGYTIVGPGAPTFSVAQATGSLAVTLGQPTAASPNLFTVTPPATFSASTATLAVTANFTGQSANACLQTGAVCTANAIVDMQELVAAAGGSTLKVYVTGQTTPFATLSFGISNPNALAFDGKGDIFVANCLVGCSNGTSIDSITEFTPPYTALPVTITNGVASPNALAFNAAGDLFVSECVTCNGSNAGDTVAEYAPPFSNASAPIATVTNGVLGPQSLAFDSAGNLFVANCASCTTGGTDSVTEYAAGAYTGAPAVTVSGASVNGPSSIAIDASKNLFVANAGSTNVTEYVPPAYASTPLSVVTLGTTNAPSIVALDGSGDLFASVSGTPSILFFKPPYSNASTPATTITSGLSNPGDLAVDGLGDLYAFDYSSGRIYDYSPPLYSGTPSRLNVGGAYLPILAVLP